MAQRANPRICDLCGGQYMHFGCVATCPRHRGLRRRDVRRMLDQGQVVDGLAPTSRLIVEATYRLAEREEALQHRAAELDERLSALAAALEGAHTDLDEARRVQQVLRDFHQQGSPSPRVGQHSGQPESEPSEHGGS